MPEQISIINRIRRRLHLSFSTYDPELDTTRHNPMYEPVRLPPPLPPFSSGRTTCKKCGNVDEAGIRYSRHSDYTNGGGTNWREAMIRTCPTCGYEWAESLPTGDPNA